jgi:hypothetical protein
MFEQIEEVNSALKEEERQLAKKRSKSCNSSISKKFVTKEPFKKDDL